MQRIRKEELESYAQQFLVCGCDEFVVSPQLYSPLYTKLYDALLKGEEPNVPSYFDEQALSSEMNKCHNSFDRYLVAIYNSRFELANPLPLNSKQMSQEALMDYLVKRYGKASSDKYSYNKDRVIKDILTILPESQRLKFKLDAQSRYRSSFYKLQAFNYKISRLNEKWKTLVRRHERGKAQQYHLDNVITHNGLDLAKSREHSSHFMALYYELDQSSPDGKDNLSRLISVLPTAFEVIEEAIKNLFLSGWNNGLDLDERREEVLEFINSKVQRIKLDENKKIELSKIPHPRSKYQDPHLEFCDCLRTCIIKNNVYNKLLAKRASFKELMAEGSEWRTALIALINPATWLNQSLSDTDLSANIFNYYSQYVEQMPLNIGNDLFKIGETLAPFISDMNPGISEIEARNIGLLIATASKHLFPKQLKGSLKGANNQGYSHNLSLKKSITACKGREYSRWKFETVFRPSLLHLITICSELILYSKQGYVKTLDHYQKLQCEAYEVFIDVHDLLSEEHHYLILGIAEAIFPNPQCASPSDDVFMPNLMLRFWMKTEPNFESLEQHLKKLEKRKECLWPKYMFQEG
ncbi:MAG: hypothetical protein HAW67_02820 [Endozoicomonadaceae bacterium]|nr:hypothetical protein [Endozoicomonadaceae bacterium]